MDISSYQFGIQLFVASIVLFTTCVQHKRKIDIRQQQHSCKSSKSLNIINTNDVLVIGIAGGSGSGKTTLAQAIFETIGRDKITYITHDSYYRDLHHLPIHEREKNNFDHPDSLETSLLVEHVKSLKNNEPAQIPQYDFTTHTRILNGFDEVYPKKIILIEGILIFTDPTLYNLIDIKIYVDTDDDIRLLRRIQRDTIERGRSVQSIIDQYITTVRPMYIEFVAPSKRNADVIVPSGLNAVALDLIIHRLDGHYNSRQTVLSSKV